MPEIPVALDPTLAAPNTNAIAEMQAEDLQALYNRICYAFSTNPSVRLEVVGSGGTLGTMTDTRNQAGAMVSQTITEGGFASEADTPNISTISTSYATLNMVVDTVAQPTDSGHLYPLMTSVASNNLQSMNEADMLDNFILPALQQLVNGGTGAGRGGAYFISTATSVSGATRVSATPVFVDTRANAAAYTSGGIPEALDQPTTVNNYYLYKNTPSAPSMPSTGFPLVWDPTLLSGAGAIRALTASQFDAICLASMRWHAVTAGDVPSRIRYSINGGGTTMGTAMADTDLGGSSASGYTQRFVNTSDYRTQEFPNGTPTTVTTYNLRAELY